MVRGLEDGGSEMPFQGQLVRGVQPFIMTLFWVTCTVGIFFFIWTLANWRHTVVRASQPGFLILAVIGTIISSVALAAQLMESDFGCVLTIWTYSIGFTTTFGSLFVKQYRMISIFNHGLGLKRREEKCQFKAKLDKKMRMMVIALIFVNVVVLLLWTLTDEIKFTFNLSEKQSGTFGYCVSTYSVVYILAIGFYNFILLILGNYMAFLSRKINSVFSETVFITYVMLSILQIYFFAGSIIALLEDDLNTGLLLRSGVIFLPNMTIQIMVFGSKFYFVCFGSSKHGIGGDLLSARRSSKRMRYLRMLTHRKLTLGKSSRIEPSSAASELEDVLPCNRNNANGLAAIDEMNLSSTQSKS